MPVPAMQVLMAAGGGPAWTPLDLGSTLFIWLSPANTASITSASGAVSQINDLSPNARHFTQTTAAAKPVTGTRTINGFNVLDFTGTDDCVLRSSQTLAQPFTVAALAQSDNTGAGTRCIFGTNTRRLNQNGNTFEYFAGGSLQTGGTPGTTPHAVVGIFNGASSSLRVDGAVVSSGNPGTGGYASNTFQFGNATSTSLGWDGVLGDLVVCNTALTGGDLTDLETYLMDLGGI